MTVEFSLLCALFGLMTALWPYLLHRRARAHSIRCVESLTEGVWVKLIEANNERFQEVMPQLLDQIPTRLDPQAFESRVVRTENEMKNLTDKLARFETSFVEIQNQWENSQTLIRRHTGRVARDKRTAAAVDNKLAPAPLTPDQQKRQLMADWRAKHPGQVG